MAAVASRAGPRHRRVRLRRSARRSKRFGIIMPITPFWRPSFRQPDRHTAACRRRAARDHREAVRSFDPSTMPARHARASPRCRSSWLFVLDADALPAIGLSQLDEIGQAVGIAVRIAAFIGQLLPLADHAHIFVVEDEDLDRQAVLEAVPSSWIFIWMLASPAISITSAVRIAQAARRWRRAGRNPSSRGRRWSAICSGIKPEILRRPHLVLADLGGDDRLMVAGQRITAVRCSSAA